jgi:hypothetical protein
MVSTIGMCRGLFRMQDRKKENEGQLHAGRIPLRDNAILGIFLMHTFHDVHARKWA